MGLQHQWVVLEVRPQNLRAAVAEDDAWAETTAQVAELGSVGDVPLIVLAAGLGVAEGDPGLNLTPQEAQRVDSIWRSLQEDHLTRSTNARLVVAENSGHYIYNSEPEIVVDAISDLTTAK